MVSSNENGWLSSVLRQAGIRKCLIIHGNVLDAVYSKKNDEYQILTDVLSQVLTDRGFDHVIRWDWYSGLQNIPKDLHNTIIENVSKIESDSSENEGEEYDIGEESPSSSSTRSEDIKTNAEDFFPILYNNLIKQNPERYAFIIDWSNYLFGNSNALSEKERLQLLMISKAIRNAPVPTSNVDGLSKPTNVLLLICNNLGSIPPQLYQANPAVQEIVIPQPGRNEREVFIKRSIDKWLLRTPLQAGTSTFTDFVDSLDGFKIRDLQQLLRLSRQVGGDPLTPDRLINLYKYGEQKSPWEDLNRAKLASIGESLQKRVKGQGDAIDKVANVIIRAFTGLAGLQHSKKQAMPKGVLFFVGPTGVGKTELAKALAQFLFGDEDACVRFDMSEFNHEHSDQRLVGAPPGYVGYEEGGQLTNAVKNRPFSVVLFDEIEKAHVRILDKFLQILEDGRLTDGKGETVYFSETVIIFTSNIGVSEVLPDQDQSEVKKQFMEKVKAHFIEVAKRPELLNRIGDNIVPFNFITGEDFLIQIAKVKLMPLKDRLKEKYRISDIRFADEEKALSVLVNEIDTRMGGRGVLNELVKRIIDPLAMFLFEEEEDIAFYAGKTLIVHQAGDKAKYVFSME